MITLSQFTFAYNYDESNTCTYLHSNFQVPFTLWKIWNFCSKIENPYSTQHFCTKLEYFQDKTPSKVQKQKMEFWTQNSILPQCAFIAKVWITLHGWVGFYWVVKPRHISTWTVDIKLIFHHIWSQLMIQACDSNQALPCLLKKLLRPLGYKIKVEVFCTHQNFLTIQNSNFYD